MYDSAILCTLSVQERAFKENLRHCLRETAKESQKTKAIFYIKKNTDTALQ
jgi:hypothetical protein